MSSLNAKTTRIQRSISDKIQGVVVDVNLTTSTVVIVVRVRVCGIRPSISIRGMLHRQQTSLYITRAASQNKRAVSTIFSLHASVRHTKRAQKNVGRKFVGALATRQNSAVAVSGIIRNAYCGLNQISGVEQPEGLLDNAARLVYFVCRCLGNVLRKSADSNTLFCVVTDGERLRRSTGLRTNDRQRVAVSTSNLHDLDRSTVSELLQNEVVIITRRQCRKAAGIANDNRRRSSRQS